MGMFGDWFTVVPSVVNRQKFALCQSESARPSFDPPEEISRKRAGVLMGDLLMMRRRRFSQIFLENLNLSWLNFSVYFKSQHAIVTMWCHLWLPPSHHQHRRTSEWFASVELCTDAKPHRHMHASECISTIEFLFLDLVKFLSLFNQVVGKSFKCLKINFLLFFVKF